MTWTLVTGAPRSGTTLMRQLISHHPLAGIFHECGLTNLVRRIEQLRSLGSATYVTEDSFGRHVGAAVPAGLTFNAVAESFYAEREGDPDQVERSTMPRRPGDLGFDALAAAVVGAAFGKPYIRVVGDKSPITLGWSEYRTARDRLGTVKVVLILRSPLDTVNSSLRRRERARASVDEWHIRSVEQACDEYASAWSIAREILPEAGSDVHVVRYDELCRDQETVMRGVFEFLELSPIPPAEGVRALPRELAASYLTPPEHAHACRIFSELERQWNDMAADRLLAAVDLLGDCPLDEIVDLTAAPGSRLLVYGFARPEHKRVWIKGPLGIIRFRHPSVTGRLLVELWTGSGCSGTDRQSDILITANGVESLKTVSGASERLVFLSVPATGDVLDIRIEPLCPGPVTEDSPADPRRIEVALTRLRISAVRASVSPVSSS